MLCKPVYGLLGEVLYWSGNPFRKHMIYYGRCMISSFGTILQIQSISWSSAVCKTHITSSLHMLLMLKVWAFWIQCYLGMEMEISKNSYLYYKICHLASRKQNVPYSQFNRQRKNFTSTQIIWIIKFLEKCYNSVHIQDGTRTNLLPKKI